MSPPLAAIDSGLRKASSLARRAGHIFGIELAYRLGKGRFRAELEELLRLPRNLHIEGTNACNADCVFCAYSQMTRPKSSLPMATFRRVVDEYVAAGGKVVSLTPIVGDPLLDRSLFERLDYLAEQASLRAFYFYTNAILLRPETAERLLGFGEALRLNVSLGGFDRETYRAIMGVDAYEVVRRNIEGLVAAKERTGSATVVTLDLRCPLEARTGEFWEVCQGWRGRGLVDINTIPHYDSWGGQIADSALQAAGLLPSPKPHKRGACEMLLMKPVVLSDGRVNACACRDVDASLVIGNVEESSLGEIWGGAALRDLIARHEEGDYPDVCRRCTWYNSVYDRGLRGIHVNRAAQEAFGPEAASDL